MPEMEEPHPPPPPQPGVLPEEVVRATEHRARWTKRWLIVCIVTFIVGYCGRWMPGPFVWISVLCVLLWIVSFFMLLLTRSRFKRDLRRRDVLPLQVAPSEPVLYLRSFNDDQAAARLRGQLTEEEHLMKVLNSIGAVIAIGRPHEYRPELGAARMYVSDDEWQSVVARQIQAARLVMIRTGSSQGLLWEIDKVVRLVSPERLVMIVDDKKEMRACLKQIRQVHPQVRESISLGWRRIGSIRGFLVFDKNWRVLRLKLRRSACSRQQQGSVIGPRLSRTLRPLFVRLNVPWHRPQRDWAKVAVALCCAAIFGVLVISGIMQ